MIQNNANGLKVLISYSKLFEGVPVETFIKFNECLSEESKMMMSLILKAFTMNRNRINNLKTDIDYLYCYGY